MKMGRCAVLNCSSRSETENGKISLHRFPRDAESVKVWLDFCGRKGNEYVQHWRLCNMHFDSNQFANTFQVRLGYAKNHTLKRNAMPTLHPPKSKRDQEIASNSNSVAVSTSQGTSDAELRSLKFENTLLKKINEDLGNEIIDLKMKNHKAEQTIDSLRRQLDASEVERLAFQMKFIQSDINRANANTASIAGVEKTDDFETQLPLYYIDNARLYKSPICQNSSESKSDFKIYTGIVEEVKSEPED